MISSTPGLVSLYFSLIVFGISAVILLIVLLVSLIRKVLKQKIPIRSITISSVFFKLMLIQILIVSSKKIDPDKWFIYWIIGNLAIALFCGNLIRSDSD